MLYPLCERQTSGLRERKYILLASRTRFFGSRVSVMVKFGFVSNLRLGVSFRGKDGLRTWLRTCSVETEGPEIFSKYFRGGGWSGNISKYFRNISEIFPKRRMVRKYFRNISEIFPRRRMVRKYFQIIPKYFESIS